MRLKPAHRARLGGGVALILAMSLTTVGCASSSSSGSTSNAGTSSNTGGSDVSATTNPCWFTAEEIDNALAWTNRTFPNVIDAENAETPQCKYESEEKDSFGLSPTVRVIALPYSRYGNEPYAELHQKDCTQLETTHPDAEFSSNFSCEPIGGIDAIIDPSGQAVFYFPHVQWNILIEHTLADSMGHIDYASAADALRNLANTFISRNPRGDLP